MYHLVFAPPKSAEVADRLVEEPGGVEENMNKPLAFHHRHSMALGSTYSAVSKTFNADQPIEDLFDQGKVIPNTRMVVQSTILSSAI